MKYRTGFTLIELSIVLIIIGLITSGILVGREMLRQSQITSVVVDEQRYAQAVQQFQQKYGMLPGDFSGATNYWGAAGGNSTDNYTTSCWGNGSQTSTATCNGNGDGQVAQDIGSDPEQELFWKHLSNAAFIQGQYTGAVGSGGGLSDHVVGTNCPATRLEGVGFGVVDIGPYSGNSCLFAGNYGHYFSVGTYTQGYPPANPALTALEMQALDTKYDDGYPTLGNIRGDKNTCSFDPNCTTGTTPTAGYNIGSTGRVCRMIFISGF